MTYIVKIHRWVGDDDTGYEQTFEIEGTVSPIIHGVFSGPPERCYPDEGGEVEIERVWLLGLNENRDAVTRTDVGLAGLTLSEVNTAIEALAEEASDDDSWNDSEPVERDDY